MVIIIDHQSFRVLEKKKCCYIVGGSTELEAWQINKKVFGITMKKMLKINKQTKNCCDCNKKFM